MPHFHIEGLPPFDGDFPFDVETLTNRELHLVKQLSGVRAAEFEEAFGAGDNDLLVAFTVIALQRSGFKVDPDQIWEAEVGRIQFVLDDKESGKLPPPNAPVESAELNGRKGASGESSRPASDLPEHAPSPTGPLLSDTGSDSDLATSER